MNSPNVYALQPALLEFKGWPKIPRVRLMVITEKIDGTNAAVGIMLITEGMRNHPDLGSPAVTVVRDQDGTEYMVYAQSRKRIISAFDDNYGFGKWVADNAATLVKDLGPGLHFGEWWGNGIQRGYGQSQKIFSLFNTMRFQTPSEFFETPNLRTVPVLARHDLNTQIVNEVLLFLSLDGSSAAPGYMNPEGIVIHNPDTGASWKKTLDRDQPKSLAAVAEAV